MRKVRLTLVASSLLSKYVRLICKFLLKDFLHFWSRLVEGSTDSSGKNQPTPDELLSKVRTWFDFATRQCASKRSPENEVVKDYGFPL